MTIMASGMSHTNEGMDVSRLDMHGLKFDQGKDFSWAVSKHRLSMLWNLLVMVYTATVVDPFAAPL